MSFTLAEIYGLAMDLTAEERAPAGNSPGGPLPEAPSAEIEAAWAAEIERRVADLNAGRVKLVSWDEIRAGDVPHRLRRPILIEELTLSSRTPGGTHSRRGLP